MAKRGGFPMGGRGGGSMQSMMQQAQRMQQNIEKVQNELAEAEVEATAGGGVVTAVVTGNKTLKKVTIAPEAVDPEDVEMAVNEALTQGDAYAEEQMSKVTGGMNLGGLF